MMSRRLYFVAILSTLFLSVTLFLMGGLKSAHAQCEGGAECEKAILPTATPVLSGASGPIVPLVDFNYDGTTLVINGSLDDINNVTFDRRTETDAQICDGDDTIHNDMNYHAYIITNVSGQVQTVVISLTKILGNLQPVLHIYDTSFDPANPADNCIKADVQTGDTAQINNFTWSPGQQLVVVATGYDRDHDEANDFELTIVSAGSEQEPNDNIGDARPITPNIDWITAEISATGDIDYYRFEGVMGQRIWIYVRTDQSTASQDSQVELRKGGDVIVTSDTDNGGQSGDSSAIAGFRLPETRPYFVRVTEQGDDDTISPYYLYVYLSDQDPTLEEEFNNDTSTATQYDIDGGLTYQLPPQLFTGHQNNTTNGEDFFKFIIPSNSVIFASLDTDADDNSTEFNGTLSLYDVAGTQVVSVTSANTTPLGEALSYGQVASETVTSTVWYASVISPGNGINLPYNLLVGYSPNKQGDVTYGLNKGEVILDDGTPLTSELISGNFCMDNLDVWLDLDHDNLDDLDVSLRAPDGTIINLFTDLGGDENSLTITLDDEGGLAPIPDDGVDAADSRIGGRYQTENGTLSELYQQSGIGHWFLTIIDDTPGNNDLGTVDKLNSWALIMHCEDKEYVYLPVIFKP